MNISHVQPWILALIGFGAGAGVTAILGYSLYQRKLAEAARVLAIVKKELDIVEHIAEMVRRARAERAKLEEKDGEHGKG